jgi:hypothetical protein
MTIHEEVVEYVLLAIALIGASGGILNRIKTQKGIGLRFIQYLGIVVLLPLIGVLSLEGRISQEITGAIAAAAVGAVLAGVGKSESESK